MAQATLVNYLSVVVMAGSSILIARALGPSGRGEFAAIMAWFAVSLAVSELGQSGAVAHWVARVRSRAREFVASARAITLVTSGVVGVVALFLAPIFAKADPALTTAYWVVFLGVIANGIWAPFVYATQASSIRAWNLIRASQPLAYATSVVVLFLVEALTLVSLACALTGSSLLQFAVAHVIARRLRLSSGRATREAVDTLSRYGLAYAGSHVPMTLSTQYDKAVLSQSVPNGDLGQYAVAGTVAGLSAPLATAISSVFFPRMSTEIVDSAERSRSEMRAIAIAAWSTGTIVLCLALLAMPFVPLLFGAEFLPAVTLVWWLAPAMFLRGVTSVITMLIQGRSKPILVIWVRLAGLGVGAASILPMIYAFGVVGGAISVTLAEITVLIASFIQLRRLRRTSESESK